MVDLTKQLAETKDNSELLDILKSATQFCKDYGYESLEIHIDEKDCFYIVHVILCSGDSKKIISGFVPNPIKATMQDIEKRFGFPVEIVP